MAGPPDVRAERLAARRRHRAERRPQGLIQPRNLFAQNQPQPHQPQPQPHQPQPQLHQPQAHQRSGCEDGATPGRVLAPARIELLGAEEFNRIARDWMQTNGHAGGDGFIKEPRVRVYDGEDSVMCDVFFTEETGRRCRAILAVPPGGICRRDKAVAFLFQRIANELPTFFGPDRKHRSFSCLSLVYETLQWSFFGVEESFASRSLYFNDTVSGIAGFNIYGPVLRMPRVFF